MTPTFNSTALCTSAARDEVLCPDVRIHARTMPGVDGQFIQDHGYGGRDIRVTGVLEGADDTPAESDQALKSAVRTIQSLADGSTIATYVGTDGHSYDYCVLIDYRIVESVGIRKNAGGGYTSAVLIQALIRHLRP